MAVKRNRALSNDERAKERTRLAALKLAAIQRRLDPGDDYFVVSVGLMGLDEVFDANGASIGPCSHAALQGFVRRAWVVEQDYHEKGRLFAITPEGHEAVENVGKVKAA